MILRTFTKNLSFFDFSALSLTRLISCLFFLISVALASPCLANYAYVTNNGNDSVSVIDTETNTVIASINLPPDSNCQCVAISPDGSHAYVSSYNGNMVAIINTATNTIERTITGLTGPMGIAITPDGNYAYIANNAINTVSVLNINTHTITDTVIVGTYPVSIRISPDGHYAYVANHFTSNVSVIDITNNNTVLTTVSVGGSFSGPIGIAITPDGAYAYVANYYENSISVIQTSDNTVLTAIEVAISPRFLSITANGQYVYVAGYNGTVSVINTATNTLEANIQIPGAELFGSATLFSSKAYVTDNLNNLVYVIDTETQTVSHSIPVGTAPHDIAITPDLAPLPPTSLACLEKKNQFLTQADVINVITWAPASSGTAATRYIIYRDSLLNPIGEVAANEPLIFYDHNRKPTTAALYYVKAVSEAGAKSSEAVVVIHGALLPPG